MYFKLFLIGGAILFVMYLISEWLCQKSTAPYRTVRDNNDLSRIGAPSAAKVSIPTIQITESQDFSYMLDDIRNAFGKLYQRVNNEAYIIFKHCGSELATGIYFGKTKYTGETNRNGKREVALLLSDGTIAGKLSRKDWNNYEKNFDTDNLNWIGMSFNGELEVSVAEKFKEGYIKNQLDWYSSSMADSKLRDEIRQEVEKQNLTVGEFHNKKSQKGKGYEEGTYELDYNNKYQIAGCYHYVESPFVAVGYAEKDPTNEYNSNAMVVKTQEGIKVGYVAEKDLKKFYEETGGAKTPLILEAHYYNGRLYGWLYTYTDNTEEYPYMASQYHKLLNEI